MKLAIMTLFFALHLSCAATHVVDPNRPNGPGDCKKACANLQGAGCEEGDPTPKQKKPCEVWCLDYHEPRGEPGYMPPWSGCVARAGADPEAIESCNMKCTR